MVLDTILIINPFNFQILNITRMADKKIITLDSLLDKIEPFKESIFNKPFTSDKPSLPWKIPSSSICEEWEKINLILKKSMEIQSSKIPDTHPLTRFILSNACFIVSGLLQHYLKSLKFYEDAKVVYGVLLWPDEIKEGVNYDGKDFEFLLFQIGGQIMPNAIPQTFLLLISTCLVVGVKLL